MARILIIEDDAAISNLIKMNLNCKGYRCFCAPDGKDAVDLLEKEVFDLILLDLMLPGIDGYGILEYSKTKQIPVMIVSAKNQIQDKVFGLKLGAEDYITKPFHISELLARVEVILRRERKQQEMILHFKDLVVNIDSREVLKQQKLVPLTVKEFDLLVELLKHPNIAFYREQLYERVWKEPFCEDTRTIDTHIQKLRKKLGLEQEIVTVFRIGYKLEMIDETQ